MSIANSAERYFVSLVNETRAQFGLDPLRIEQSLNSSADAHSSWMLAADVFSHEGRNGSSSTDRIKAAGLDLSGQWMTSENIAYRSATADNGLRDDVRALHQMLMDSSEHRANILNPEAELVGIGLKLGTFTQEGRDYTVLMVTQNFAATDGAVRIDYSNGLPHLPAPDVRVVLPDRAEWRDHFDGQTFRNAPGGPVDGTDRSDDIRLGPLDNVVRAGSGYDWVAGGDGNDTLHGQGGSDCMLGEGGNDRIAGGVGNDRISGGAGRDLLLGQDGNDHLSGGSGVDSLYGGADNDRLSGGSSADRLYGDDGHDFLSGDAGYDRLNGGRGDDTIDGGRGNDVLRGGGGEDSFVFAKGDGIDRVVDFNPSQDRVLIEASALGSSDQDFIDHAIRETANGVIVDLIDGDRIVFYGENLTAEDVTNAIFLT